VRTHREKPAEAGGPTGRAPPRGRQQQTRAHPPATRHSGDREPAGRRDNRRRPHRRRRSGPLRSQASGSEPGGRSVSSHTAADREQVLDELLEIGLAVASERDLYALLDRILEAARRFTRAEAGTLFLRDGDRLRFAVVQNDLVERKLARPELQQRFEAEPLRLSEPSLAGHVAQTGEVVNVADAHAIGVHQTRAFNERFDVASDYATRSVLAVPLQDLAGSIIGVLELLNAVDDSGATVAFHRDHEKLIRALAAHAAVAIRNARLENISFKDSLTELYN